VRALINPATLNLLAFVLFSAIRYLSSLSQANLPWMIAYSKATVTLRMARWMREVLRDM